MSNTTNPSLCRVLSSLYQSQLPDVRRVHSVLLLKLRKEIGWFLVDVEAEGSRVWRWSHRQLEEATRRRYLSYPDTVRYLHTCLAELFLGTWAAGKEKPFEFTQHQRQKFDIKEKSGTADRKVATQPLVYLNKEGELTRFNLRKFSELPFHLIRGQMFNELFSEVLFNYKWLHAKLSSCPLETVIADFQEASESLREPVDRRQVLMVQDALKLGAGILSKIPDMLAGQLVGRLLPDIWRYPHIAKLVDECDQHSSSHCALTPISHCLLSPGGPMKFSLEGHNFAIFGFELTSGGRYVISVSNKFLTWDLASSEICRDVDPHIEGLMLGLAVSKDWRSAAAFTSINQVVVLDVMLGQFLVIERPLEPGDEVVGLAMAGDRVAVYNHHYWRAFSLTGKLLSEEHFSVELPIILEMRFISQDHYVAVFWTGDFEYNDRRIEILVSNNKDKSETLIAEQAYCLTIQENEVTAYILLKLNQNDNNEKLDEGDTEERSNKSFQIAKFIMKDCSWVKVFTISEDTPETHQLSLSGDQKELISTTVEGFRIFPLASGGVEGLCNLALPTEFRNVISRPSGSNSCVLNKAKDTAMAGAREAIFVWDIGTEQLLKQFQGHYGRIIQMCSLTEGKWNHAITSSMDRTIKVWDMSTILEDVHRLDRHENGVLAVMPCEAQGLAVTMTRSGMGVWHLRTGHRISTFSRARVGAVITAAAISRDSKTLVTAESDMVRQALYDGSCCRCMFGTYATVPSSPRVTSQMFARFSSLRTSKDS